MAESSSDCLEERNLRAWLSRRSFGGTYDGLWEYEDSEKCEKQLWCDDQWRREWKAAWGHWCCAVWRARLDGDLLFGMLSYYSPAVPLAPGLLPRSRTHHATYIATYIATCIATYPLSTLKRSM